MNITIFGATGLVGKQLVKIALFAGHKVTAYGRNVYELISEEERDQNLVLVKGGLFDKTDVADAIKNADIVLSAIGGTNNTNDNTRSLGIKNITEAMLQQGVTRIIAIGGLGCLQATADTLMVDTESFPEEYKAVTAEHLKALEYLKNSGLNYTFVCPPTIVDTAEYTTYKTNKDYAMESYTINVNNLAAFILAEATENNFVQCKVAIGNS